MHEQPPNLPPDRMLADGRYELCEVLGSGGMAHVYRARDHQLKVDRAIKVIRTEGRVSKTRHRRLKVEARAMARVRHPHILTIYDVGETEYGPYVVMDLALGGALDGKLATNGPLPPVQASIWMAQILEGLEAAHAEGVVHRDVKPSNILLDESGAALLADFGIAMLTDDQERHTRTGVTMGSVSYMAPEQRLDARAVDATADVYAAGCTLYNLVTMATPVDLFTAHEGSPRWEDVPLALRKCIYKATRLEPESRFKTAGEFAVTLRQIIAQMESGIVPAEVSMLAIAEVVDDELETLDPHQTVETGAVGWFRRSRDWLNALTETQLAALATPFLLFIFISLMLGVRHFVAPVVRAPAEKGTEQTQAVIELVEDPISNVPVPTAPPTTPSVVATPEPTAEPTATPRRTPKPTPKKVTPKRTPTPTPTPTSPPMAVSGKWVGNLGPNPISVELTGTASKLSGVTYITLGGDAAPSKVRGSYNTQSRLLSLEDIGEDVDLGSYKLTLDPSGKRLKGQFHRANGMGVVPVSLRRKR